MSIQYLKKLKQQTSASFSECKKALAETSSFEAAVTLATQLRQQREEQETAEELQRHQTQQLALAEKNRTAQAAAQELADFADSIGLSNSHTARLLNSCQGNKEQVRQQAQTYHKEQAEKERQRVLQNRSKYHDWDMESLLKELVAWLDDPLDLSESGLGNGFKSYGFLDGPVPRDVGPILRELHRPENRTAMGRLLEVLVSENPSQEQRSQFMSLNWEYLKAQPIGDRELLDCFKVGHSGIFQGLAELVNAVLHLDMSRDD